MAYPPVQSTTEALLAPAELERLRLLMKHRPARLTRTTQHAGANVSLFRGQGMAFEDLRPYQQGDEVRHLHWRATARSGKPIVKVFREERARALHIVMDRTASMAFGTRRETKAQSAARATALFACAAAAAQDPVGIVLRETTLRELPPARGWDALWPVLTHVAAPLDAAAANTPARYSHIAQRLMRVASRGATTVLIGDFLSLEEDDVPALRQLAERCELLAVHVVDPAEEELPAAGRLRLATGTGGDTAVIDTGDPHVRARYASARAAWRKDLREKLARAGARHWPVYTHLDTYAQLEPLL